MCVFNNSNYKTFWLKIDLTVISTCQGTCKIDCFNLKTAILYVKTN